MAGKVEITSSCPDGTVIIMDSWVSPSDSEKYLQLCRPITAEFRKHPENLFAAISVNPTDKGQIRITHGWTRNSAWFWETFVNGTLFKDFFAQATPMWTKPRVIEHFDRYVDV